MALDVKSQAELISGSAQGQVLNLKQTENRGLLIEGGLPPYAEMTRRGNRWKVATSTAFAPVAAVPTTTAPLEIVNNHATLCMVIDTIWVWQLLGTAVVWSITPWAQVGAAVYSGNTALNIYSANGSVAYASATGTPAKTAINQTVVAAGWEPFPGSTMNFGLAAATPGGAVIGQVDGRLVVPPGKALHVAVSGSVATASSMQCGASWVWAAVTNET